MWLWWNLIKKWMWGNIHKLWVFGSTALQSEHHLAWFHLCCLQTTSHLPWGPPQYADVLLSCLRLLVHLQAKCKWGSECASSYPDNGVEGSLYLPAFVPNDWCQSQELVSLQSTQDEWQTVWQIWGSPYILVIQSCTSINISLTSWASLLDSAVPNPIHVDDSSCKQPNNIYYIEYKEGLSIYLFLCFFLYYAFQFLSIGYLWGRQVFRILPALLENTEIFCTFTRESV